MSDENTEPAFPVFDSEHYPQYRGMTLRDWFAGQAMAGFCAYESLYVPKGETEAQHISKLAYNLADAMMEARKKPK